jgi:serine/threonine-protein kinase RsbW
MDAPDTPRIGQPTRRSDVELRLPADGAYVSVLRTAASGLAARLDFTIDDIEDVRMAVSEACALALPEADEESDLVAEFYLNPGSITASVSVTAADPKPADFDSWAWQVLTALTAEATSSAAEGRFTVSMTLRSAVDF